MKNLKLIKKFIKFLKGYYVNKVWKLSKNRVLIFEFLSGNFSDNNYHYFQFTFLPCIYVEKRTYHANKYKEPTFDYFEFNLCFLSFQLCLTYQLNY